MIFIWLPYSRQALALILRDLTINGKQMYYCLYMTVYSFISPPISRTVNSHCVRTRTVNPHCVRSRTDKSGNEHVKRNDLWQVRPTPKSNDRTDINVFCMAMSSHTKKYSTSLDSGAKRMQSSVTLCWLVPNDSLTPGTTSCHTNYMPVSSLSVHTLRGWAESTQSLGWGWDIGFPWTVYAQIRPSHENWNSISEVKS